MRTREGSPAGSITLALCGDVMTGRGIDQLLLHPSRPTLHEPYVQDARDYVELAERAAGAIRRPVPPGYPWGDALEVMAQAAPDARIVNLETSVTVSQAFDTAKEIHYRMHPRNVACLTAARVDACSLANNHVLDFGRGGLLETLSTLESAGIAVAGAGRDLRDARAPARVVTPAGTVLLCAAGTDSSGIPASWAAGAGRPGVAFLPDLSDDAADALAARARAGKRAGDVTVVSIHWGPNWGYEVSPDERRFARRLVDGGVDVVHGHSSHHPRPLEVHRGKLVLYGCGDFVNDYEGISGHEALRGDLRPLYLARLSTATGALEDLRIAVFRSVGLALRRAPPEDVEWLRSALEDAGRDLGTRLEAAPPDGLRLPLDRPEAVGSGFPETEAEPVTGPPPDPRRPR